MSANEKDLKAIKDRIYNLIRSGMKTSEISAECGYPLHIIKDVKSQFIEDEKKREREAKREESLKHMARKRDLHHQRFLERIGQKAEGLEENLPVEAINDQATAEAVAPAEQSQDATVQAPALGGDLAAN